MAHFHQQRTTTHSSYETKSSNFNTKPQPKPSTFFQSQPTVHQPIKIHCEEPDENYLMVTEDQIMNFLERYDMNRDGFLSKCELTKAFEDLGAFFPAWRTGRALAVADKDGDGHVGLDELEDVLLYAKKSGYKIQV